MDNPDRLAKQPFGQPVPEGGFCCMRAENTRGPEALRSEWRDREEPQPEGQSEVSLRIYRGAPHATIGHLTIRSQWLLTVRTTEDTKGFLRI